MHEPSASGAKRAPKDAASLAKRCFDHTVIDFNEITKAGKTRVAFDCVPIERAAEYAAEGADASGRSHTSRQRSPTGTRRKP